MANTEANIGGKVIPLVRPGGNGFSDRTDDELMELACANHQDAMTELIGRYHQRVRSYCHKWNPERGDDLAQEVFLKLWRARQRYRPQDQFAVYLFTIVRNVCRNTTRKWFRRPFMDSLSDLVIADQHPDQLDDLLVAERERKERKIGTILMLIEGGLILAGTATLGILDWQGKLDSFLGESSRPLFYTAMGGIGLMSLGTAAIWSYKETTIERTLRLYRGDPDLKIRFGFAPVSNGAAVGVSGTF